MRLAHVRTTEAYDVYPISIINYKFAVDRTNLVAFLGLIDIYRVPQVFPVQNVQSSVR